MSERTVRNIDTMELSYEQRGTLNKIVKFLEAKDFHVGYEHEDECDTYKSGEYYIDVRFLDEVRCPNCFTLEHVVNRCEGEDGCGEDNNGIFSGVKVYTDGKVSKFHSGKVMRDRLNGCEIEWVDYIHEVFN